MNLKNILCKAKKIESIRNLIIKQKRTYHISIEPKSCLLDIPAAIRATGLKPNEKATVTVRTKTDKGESFSYAYYNANLDGCIDLTKDFSQGGSYTGCLPMGLISTLHNVDPEKRFRAFVTDVRKPLQLNISLLPGHVDGDRCTAEMDPDCLASVMHERYFMAEGCRRLAVKEGNIRGTLFLPPGPGPFPGIIDLYGSNGGLKEIRAALFASNGIAALSLAYFRYDDLPVSLNEIDLGYFEEAMQYLLGRKEIIPNGIGTIGLSQGSSIAMLMGIYLREVKAVIAVNGIPASVVLPMRVKNTVIPPLPANMNNLTFENGILNMRKGLNVTTDHPEATLPLERADAKFMFVIGEDDQCIRAQMELHLSVDRLRRHGRSNFEVLEFKDTGHFLEPPFTPFRDHFYSVAFKSKAIAGGELKAHTKAEQRAWPKMIAFFKDNLMAA